MPAWTWSRPGSLPSACEARRPGRSCLACGQRGPSSSRPQPALLGALAYGERDDGIVIVATEPATDLGRLALPERPLVAVVEQVEKPGNLGALMRSADGAGVDAVIVADALCDPWNPNAIRASQGTIFSLPMAVCASTEALAWLRQQGLAIVTARVDGDGRLRRRGPAREGSPSSSARRPRAWARPGRART